MKNIVLTGFMGTGKTSVAKQLSSMLGMKIVDMDSEIEKTQGKTINDIFAQLGEPFFRDLETEMAQIVSAMEHVIISTGGGVVLRPENIEYLRKNGIVVCLMASADTILKRTRSTDERPLLKVDDPLAQITEMLDVRKPFYKNADLVIDTEGKSPRQVAEEIIRDLQWKK